MTREIKFRAWDKENKKFVYIFVNQFYIIHERIKDFVEKFNLNGGKWEQYTGLHDKNGKEIYEGDIVVIGSLEDSPLGVVEYDQDWGRYSIKDNEKYQFGGEHVCIYTTEKFEIIGNIYSNPDLLNK